MIKFVADKDGKPVLGLGLSRENINRLTAGQPIVVRGEDVEMPQIGEVLLFFGEDELNMTIALAKAGLIGADTEIRGHANPIDDDAPTRS